MLRSLVGSEMCIRDSNPSLCRVSLFRCRLSVADLQEFLLLLPADAEVMLRGAHVMGEQGNELCLETVLRQVARFRESMGKPDFRFIAPEDEYRVCADPMALCFQCHS
eukprot:TRINITY_DN18718_c0_g1_i2.p2 TRINITY_DN18718_c0_g1~~TRINITY_DN18718_c0_g1_i2.p2  ORF type:complete len:108 (-),score=18.71 TRINITY_DN18718_c0_g1_i2:404-727(-)